MRVTYADARGVQSSGSLRRCAGKMPGHPAARRRRRRSPPQPGDLHSPSRIARPLMRHSERRRDPALHGAVALSLSQAPRTRARSGCCSTAISNLEGDPVLIVPNRSDVDRVERELLARRPALLGGTIGTFDDLFGRIAGGARRAGRCRAQRALRPPRDRPRELERTRASSASAASPTRSLHPRRAGAGPARARATSTASSPFLYKRYRGGARTA